MSDESAKREIRFEEWLSLLFLPIAFALCNEVEKPIDFRPDSYYRFFLPAIASFVLLAPLILYIRKKMGHESSSLSLLGFLRDWWTLPLCFVLYSNMKVLVPLYSKFVYDQTFLYWETRIFEFFTSPGQYPTKYLLEVSSPSFTYLMDQSYISFFYLYPISFAFLYFGGFRKEFRRLLCGIILIYYIGALIYLALPVVGPIYYPPCSEVRELVAQRSSEIGGATVPKLQAYLLINYKAITDSPRDYITRPFVGIAAFPSLHVAHTLLFLLSAWKTSKWLFAAYCPLFITLSLSTVFWGWHWVGDVIAGALITLIVFPLLGKYLEGD